ncbi:MAG: DNA methyltransferase Dim-2 [Peltula sp. TS41687]|nr:MAG: DNA methyltransferase Dim-2 [Peltula sp. TS41687]
MAQVPATSVPPESLTPPDHNNTQTLHELATEDIAAKESTTTATERSSSAQKLATSTATVTPSSPKSAQNSPHDSDEEVADELLDEAEEGLASWEISKNSAHRQRTLVMVGIHLPGLIYPKSQHLYWLPPMPPTEEGGALDALPTEAESGTAEKDSQSKDNSEGGYISYRLENFSIYKPDSGMHPNEFAPLHHLCVKMANNAYCFDGILEEGNTRRYVENVPFKILSIGNHHDLEQHGVGDQLWIQSTRQEKTDIWYQLGAPAPEYQRYHTQFVWLANFAKHFVDFLHRHTDVQIYDFREKFHLELQGLHGHDAQFQAWLKEFGDSDFRRVVAANPEFLYKESVDLDRRNDRQPLWKEVHFKFLTAVRPQRTVEQLTVVTPFVYDCFKDMPWGKFLRPMEPGPKVTKDRRRKEETLGLTVDQIDKKKSSSSPAKNLRSMQSSSRASEAPTMLKEFFDEEDPNFEERERQKRLTARVEIAKQTSTGANNSTSTHIQKLPLQRPKSVHVGDVIGIKRDTDTVWKSQENIWYAYVQEVKTNSRGQSFLKVIWLYAPSDTTCAAMHYPIKNELFFSDHCNCGDDAISYEDVACKVTVDFFGDPRDSIAEYIVRQKYKTGAATFVTLKMEDLRCVHRSGPPKSRMEIFKSEYRVGDTVLIRMRIGQKEDGLEPVEIIQFSEEDSAEVVLVRCLPRRSRDFPDQKGVRPNELVYGDKMDTISIEKVTRKCMVRFYTEDDRVQKQIPAPYDRDGTADAFYITCRQVKGSPVPALEPLTQPFPTELIQGFDPSAPPPRRLLNGMDLYCGGGNFGRGLEEGGAIHNKWAVDYDRDAIHTYKANLKDTEGTSLYFGSVNDLLAQAMRGRYNKYVPAPGEVDFISAGSPCQGFSNANQQKSNDKSLRNSSLVASVAAFVDFYRPKYALLENVVAMAAQGKGKEKKNVFAQVICSLVGMGYQVQQFNLDAWSFGSPQSRSRLFVSIAAPGLELPPPPAISHSHPINTQDRALGVAANGIKFGLRRFEPTPFDYITAAEGTKDLPPVGDARTSTCIPYPDHRCTRFETYLTKALISQVPVVPRGQGFLLAFKRGRLGKPQVNSFNWKNKHKAREGSRSWARVNPNALLPTVTTAAQPSCSFTGTIVHWEQHRVLSIMEARRAQSFPDQDVLIGRPPAQWKIVGNSVARSLALALGITLRHAWLANEPDDDVVILEVRSSPEEEDASGVVVPSGVGNLSTGTAVSASVSDVPSLTRSAPMNTSLSRKRTMGVDTDDDNSVRMSKRGKALGDGTLFVESDLPLSVTSASLGVEKTRGGRSEARTPLPTTKRSLLSSTSHSQHISTNSTVQMAQNAPSTPVRGDRSAPICLSDDEEGSSAGGHAMSISTPGSRHTGRTVESFHTAQRVPMPPSFGNSPQLTSRRPHMNRTSITTPTRTRLPLSTTNTPSQAPRTVTQTTINFPAVSRSTRPEITTRNVPAIGNTDINIYTPLRPGDSPHAPIEFLED